MRTLHALSDDQEARARDLRTVFRELHWGKLATVVLDTDDALLPDLAQMGRLLWVNIEWGGNEAITRFPSGSHLGVEYDLHHTAAGDVDIARVFAEDSLQRLHLVTPDSHRAEVLDYYRSHRHMARPLDVLARQVGGVQARFGYPRLRAIALARVTDIVYATDKEGDGFSHYTHKFGSDGGGPTPWLAADEDGRSWLVGGNYTVPPEGITN